MAKVLEIQLQHQSFQRKFRHDPGCLGLVHWDNPEGWYGEGEGRWGSGWGTCVYLWKIHDDVWQNQYIIVK